MRTAILDISTTAHEPGDLTPYSVGTEVNVIDSATGENLAELADVHMIKIEIPIDDLAVATITTHAFRFRIRAEGRIGKWWDRWGWRLKRKLWKMGEALKA